MAGLLAMVFFPLLTPSTYLVALAIEVFIFSVYAVSYDLLMGFTGLISFGHALFFGAGAYTAGILLVRTGIPLPGVMVLVVVVNAMLAAGVGILSLRVRGVYFAMVTLAFSELFYIVAYKWTWLTGGSDGLTGIRVPDWLMNRLTFYYFALLLAGAVFLLAHRLVNSPAGKVMVAIRENETRAAVLGYNVFAFKLQAMVISGALAALAGMAYALFLDYAYPALLGIDTTVNALLMTLIGGAGTLWGGILGAAVVRLLGFWLSTLFDRWLLVFGLVYVLIVMFLPSGLFGWLKFRLVRTDILLREGDKRCSG